MFSQILTLVRPVLNCINKQPEESYPQVRTDWVPGLMGYSHPARVLFFLHCFPDPKGPCATGFWLMCQMPSRFRWRSSYSAPSTFFIRPNLQSPLKLQRISSSCHAASCLLVLQGKTLTSSSLRTALMYTSLEKQEPGRQSFHWSLSDTWEAWTVRVSRYLEGFVTVSKHQEYLFPDLYTTQHSIILSFILEKRKAFL